MKTTLQTGLRIALYGAVIAATVGCAEKPLVADAVAVPAASAQSVAEPTDAKDILMRMAQFLAKAPKYSVTIASNYDVPQESGQMIEFGESRSIIVNRPNGLRVDIEHSNGERHLVQYDGNTITTFSPDQNVYAQVDKPGGIDEAVKYFLKDLGMRLPLAVLLVSQLPDELERRTQELDYVEKTVINGSTVHHLAGRTETVDYQVWVAAGAQPLPLRIVLSYKNAPGQPQFKAQFADWNLTPKVDEAQFVFTPTEQSKKIAFAAQIPTISPVSPKQAGGK